MSVGFGWGFSTLLVCWACVRASVGGFCVFLSGCYGSKRVFSLSEMGWVTGECYGLVLLLVCVYEFVLYFSVVGLWISLCFVFATAFWVVERPGNRDD